MATTGHETETVNVAGLKGALQQYKTDITDNISKSLVGYYTCGTAAATAAKTITASYYTLLQGGSIKVKFTYKNTADNATLKIGNADAKPLYYAGRRADSSNSWEAGEVVEIFYDGTNYYANNVMGGGAGDGAFDISVYNAVEGTPTKYADLAAALGTNGANIPQSLRKGGMSVKFVQSSDNKYVQARCMAQSFTTDVTQWQGVDDKPIPGSINILESNGAYVNNLKPNEYIGGINALKTYKKEWLDGSGNVISSINAEYCVIDIENIQDLIISKNLVTDISYFMILSDFDWNHTLPYTPSYATGESGRRHTSGTETITLPQDAKYLLVATRNNATGANITPSKLVLDDIELISSNPLKLAIDDIKKDYGTKTNILNTIKGFISDIRGKKVSIIGDSISTFDKEGYKVDGYYMLYPWRDVTDVYQTWWMKIIENCGGSLEVNASFRGSCVSNSRQSQTYEGLNYPDLYDRTTAGFLGNPDLIIVALGTNDALDNVNIGDFHYDDAISNLSESTFADAYIKGIKSLKQNYPNADIVCLLLSTGTDSNNTVYNTAIKDISEHLGCKYVGYAEYEKDSVGSVHPIAYGMNQIANRLYKYISIEASDKNAEDIDIIKKNDIVYHVTWEQGTITNNGEEVLRTYRIRTIEYIPIECFSIVKTDIKHLILIVCYDSDKNFLGIVNNPLNNVRSNKECLENTAFVRFVLGDNTSIPPTHTLASTDITPSSEFDFSIYYSSVICNVRNLSKGENIDIKQKYNKLDPLLIEDADIPYENGYIQANGNITITQNWKLFKIPNFVSNVSFIVWNSLTGDYKNYKAIAFYNSETVFDNTTFISGKDFNEVQSGGLTSIDTIPANCKTILVASRKADGTPEIYANYSINKIYKEYLEIRQIAKEDNKAILNEKYDSIGNAEFWLEGISSAFSDMTWVGNKLIVFSSSSDDLTTDAGYICINEYANGIDQEKTAYYSIKHFFGHCNTVDYRPETDCLILGNGSGDYALVGKIIIIPNFSQIVGVSASSSTPLSLSDVDALVIDCSSYDLGGKFNLIWGDDNDKNYNIAYLITANIDGTTQANGGDLETIRKIVLRKDDEQGEYGSIVENNTPFNGTFDIVETYHQTTAGYPNCDQGTCYHNGELLACIGHDGAWYWRMRLADGKVFKKNYKQQTYYANKPQNYGNVSGICIKDGYLFIGRASIGVMAIRL